MQLYPDIKSVQNGITNMKLVAIGEFVEKYSLAELFYSLVVSWASVRMLMGNALDSAVDEAVRNYGKDAVIVITNYDDAALIMIKNYGDDAIVAMKNGIELSIITKMDDVGIKLIKCQWYSVIYREIADGTVEVVETLKPIGFATEQNVARLTKLIRAVVSKEDTINAIKNNIRSSAHIQNKIIDTFEEFSHFDYKSKLKLKDAVDKELFDVSTWRGKLSGNILAEKFTKEEAFAIERYLKNGYDVERLVPIPNSGSCDFIIEGLEVEFKGFKTTTFESIRSKAFTRAKKSFTPKPEGRLLHEITSFHTLKTHWCSVKIIGSKACLKGMPEKRGMSFDSIRKILKASRGKTVDFILFN